MADRAFVGASNIFFEEDLDSKEENMSRIIETNIRGAFKRRKKSEIT
jgi:hypothetical protein